MKKITRRSFLAVCGTVAAAAALTACGGSASSATVSTASSAAGSTAAGTLSGNVATGGSTSMKNVIAALTEGFAEVEPGVTVSYDPTGSGAGITGINLAYRFLLLFMAFIFSFFISSSSCLLFI